MTTRTLDMANVIASDVTIAGDKTLSGDITFSGDMVPSTPLSHRNMMINGAMQVAQRGTSSTVNGYGSIDRFRSSISGNDENATQSQHALTSSDTGPYEEGFRYSFHMTNGNQTSGAGSSDRVAITTLLEAQDIANSGWDYTSSSSYITLSFWCKSSVAQNFHGRVTTTDGTAQNYPFETGSLVADTWTKITKTIPGNSNLQFDNNNDVGLTIEFTMFRGTDTTGSITLDAWGTYDSSIRVPDMTSTWYTTNDATWEITGVQLERGSVATPFEHRSYGDEFQRCLRYYEKWKRDNNDTDTEITSVGTGYWYASSQILGHMEYFQKRSAPTITVSSADWGRVYHYSGSMDTNDSSSPVDIVTRKSARFNIATGSSTNTNGGGTHIILNANYSEYIEINAEL